MQVKICGTTSVADARLALDAGADWIGVIVGHPPSPRNVSPDLARAIREVAPDKTVLLCVNLGEAELSQLLQTVEPAVLQLHGDESPELVASLAERSVRVWKAIHGDENQLLSQARAFTEAGAESVLLDAREASANGTTYGGTGRVADWNAARALVQEGFRVILAGGLTPENVARSVSFVAPSGVDCVSGVEESKGVKDGEKVRAFVSAARAEAIVSD